MRKKTFLCLYVTLLIVFVTKTIAVDVDIYLNIVNSFSGYVNITWNNIITKSWIVYTPTTTTLAQIFSDSAWSYTITWDITTISWTQSQPYDIQTNITLNNTNSINDIYPVFRKNLEPLIQNKLQVFVDTIPPNSPIITSPTQNTNTNNPFIIDRTISSDSWAWLKEYVVLIATDQLFSTTIYYQNTPNNQQYIDTSLLPIGNLYIKILAKDEVSNINESQMVTICNKCDNTPPSWWGGWWGWGWWTYITQPESSDIQWITIIENLEKAQKTIPKEEPTIWFIGNILYDDELLDAYKYAYWLWITTMPTAYQADLKWKLLRKDLAKMISEYAIKVAKLKPDNRLICDFNDLEEETLETKYYTKLACKLWLMWRHADGKIKLDDFMPNEAVNRAQFGTVLSRTLFGENYNVHSWEEYERYQKHLFALNDKSIMKIIDTPWMVELRWRVMLMMMRADPNREIRHASAK